MVMWFFQAAVRQLVFVMYRADHVGACHLIKISQPVCMGRLGIHDCRKPTGAQIFHDAYYNTKKPSTHRKVIFFEKFAMCASIAHIKKFVKFVYKFDIPN